MASKKFLAFIGAGFGKDNLNLIIKTVKAFWKTLTHLEKKSWLDNRANSFDKTGEDTFISFFLEKYTKTDTDHPMDPIKTVRITDPTIKTFNNRAGQNLTVVKEPF